MDNKNCILQLLKKKKKQLCEVMDVLVYLIAVTIPQCIRTLNHCIVHHKNIFFHIYPVNNAKSSLINHFGLPDAHYPSNVFGTHFQISAKEDLYREVITPIV